MTITHTHIGPYISFTPYPTMQIEQQRRIEENASEQRARTLMAEQIMKGDKGRRRENSENAGNQVETQSLQEENNQLRDALGLLHASSLKKEEENCILKERISQLLLTLGDLEGEREVSGCVYI